MELKYVGLSSRPSMNAVGLEGTELMQEGHGSDGGIGWGRGACFSQGGVEGLGEDVLPGFRRGWSSPGLPGAG